MTTSPTFNPDSRSAFPSRNPFQGSPMPIPLEGWDLRAPNIFRDRPLADHLNLNAGWLQVRARTSNQVEAALFPSFTLGGMQSDEVRAQLNRSLWDAGYKPSNEGVNPTWSWAEGN